MKTALLFIAAAATHAFTPPTAAVSHRRHHARALDSTPLRMSSSTSKFEHALIFDCDGVIILTEELHRLAYNQAFEAAGLEIDGNRVEWSVEYYDVLQNTVGGGKPKMHFHFKETMGGRYPSSKDMPSPPQTEDERIALVDALQAHKTELYKQLVSEKAEPRPGVIELMDEALDDPHIAVGVCSASTKAAVTKVLDVVLGQDRRERLDVCILGDDVSKLKPDPLIYTTAAERLGIDPSNCVVVEDSLVGLRAAKGAGMKCLITYTSSTESEDFYSEGADAKVPELKAKGVTLDMIFGPMREKGVNAEILNGVKD
jgi:HAD superfamily hydrolase (TIGR01509 family)